MANKKKNSIKETELKQLQILNAKQEAIFRDLGILSSQKHGLLHTLAQIQQELNDAKKQLEVSYGKISLDIQTGEYEEVKEEEQAELQAVK